VTLKDAYVFVDSRDFGKFNANTKHAKLINVDKLEAWTSFVKKLKLKHVLIEGDYLTLFEKKNYIDPLKIPKLTSIASMPLRSVKTNDELTCMQKAADIAVNTIAHIKK
jgi:Xaa-Pro aminopeptidase